MKIIRLKTDYFSAVELKQIITTLKSGQIIILPTDTIFGFSCLINQPTTIKKINLLKKSPQNKKLLILISNYSQLKKYCRVSAGQLTYLKKIWRKGQRPGTIILTSRLKKTISVAVRQPQTKFLIQLLKNLNSPLVSTSINFSGQPELKTTVAIIKFIKKLPVSQQPQLMIINKKIPQTRLAVRPSKIIDIRNIKNIKIIRA